RTLPPHTSTLFPYTTLFRSILERICGVNTIDLGGLEHDIRLDLDRTQTGGRVGGEEWVAGTGGENNHLAGLQMTHRLATVIVIRDRKSTRLNSSHVKISYAV